MATRQRNSKKQEGKAQKIADLPKQRIEGYASFYCNHVQIGHTPWDFRMLFYEIMENDEGQLVLKEKTRVVMSPQHTKAMVRTFVLQIEKWEEQYGEIIVPGDETEPPSESPSKSLH